MLGGIGSRRRRGRQRMRYLDLEDTLEKGMAAPFNILAWRITQRSLAGYSPWGQFSSVAQCPTLCDAMNRSRPGLPVHHQLPEFTQTHVHRVSDAIQPSHPLSSPSPPAPNPSQHQSLFNESTLRMKWPKYWSFSFSIIPSKEHPGLISFRMD